MVDQYGQAAYEAYCEFSGWKSRVTGALLPSWGEADPGIQDAWDAAAAAVLEAQPKVIRKCGWCDAPATRALTIGSADEQARPARVDCCGSHVKDAAKWGNAATQPPADPSAPCAEGFQLGMAVRWDVCEVCGRPAWEHVGLAIPPAGSPFTLAPSTLRLWRPGEAEEIRARWQPTGRRPAATETRTS